MQIQRVVGATQRATIGWLRARHHLGVDLSRLALLVSTQTRHGAQKALRNDSRLQPNALMLDWDLAAPWAQTDFLRLVTHRQQAEHHAG